MARTYKILAIDGGGIRGVIPAMILEEIERRTGKAIWEMFDLIAGTSTGGILALGLTVPDPALPGRARLKAGDLVNLYVNDGRRIFPLSGMFAAARALLNTLYPAAPIQEVLKRYLGDAQLKDSLTGVLVPAYDLGHQRTFFFQNWKNRPANRPQRNFLMRDAARATSAAPAFFPPARIYSIPGAAGRSRRFDLIDGGVYINNPAVSGYIEAAKMAETDGANAPEYLVVSLGTGRGAVPPYTLEQAVGWGVFGWLNPLDGLPVLTVMTNGQTDVVEHQLQHLLDKQRYFRFDEDLAAFADEGIRPSVALDDASPENMAALTAFATCLIDRMDDRLDQLCDRLAPAAAMA